MDCIVGAEEQCYNRKAGRAHVLPADKYEEYNYEIDKIESLGSELLETGRNL
jgi:hypothetical protein